MHDESDFQNRVYERLLDPLALPTGCRPYAMICYFIEKQLAPRDRILEIGHGGGHFIRFLAEQDYTVYGMDIGREPAEVADRPEAGPDLPNVREGDIFSDRDRQFIEISVQRHGRFAAVLSRSLLVWAELGFSDGDERFRDLMNIIEPYSDLFLHQTFDFETLTTEDTIRGLEAYDGFGILEVRHPGPFVTDQTLYVLSRRPAASHLARDV